MLPTDALEVTASVVVTARAGSHIVSVVLTIGSDAASVILYDHASAASGTKKVTLKATTTVPTVVFTPPRPIPVSNGIYAALTGTSPLVYVQYE